MSRVRAVVVMCVTLGCGVSGCSWLFSFDGYAGVDASAPDGSADEAGDHATASIDAGDACIGFCDNFDDRTVLAGAWDQVEVLGGALVSDGFITSNEWKSSPHSAQFHVPARSSGPDEGVFLRVTRPLVAAATVVDFDVKVVGSLSGNAGYINMIQYAPGPQYGGSVTTGSGGVSMDYWVMFADGGHIQPIATAGPNDEQWHHVHFRAVYDLSAGSLFETWDGVTVVDLQQGSTYGTPPLPTTFTFRVGGLARAPIGAVDIYIDDVQIQ